ncbi:MAG: prolipoprotein diacylglyceryl transferase [Phycisphaerales bacterium]
MITLAAWLHDLDPYAVRLGPGFGIMWYGLSYAAGFALAWLALRFLVARGYAQISAEHVTDLVIYGALGAVIGGRLGYVLFYQPSLLWSFSGDLPYWGVLAINRGGMASHGGMIGVAIAGLLVARASASERERSLDAGRVLHVFDLFALAAPFGLLLGRLANFVNGELLGRVVARPGEPAPWWAVRFPQEIGTELDAGLRTPEQDLALARLVDEHRLPEQSLEEGLARVLGELQRGSARVAEQLEPLVSARHPSQLYQAAAEGMIVGLVVWLVARTRRSPGVVTASFLISYGLLRIATETVRLPDGHLAVARPLGLSRGQWLSSLMIVAGVALLVWVRRRGCPLIPGWGGIRPGTDAASG